MIGGLTNVGNCARGLAFLVAYWEMLMEENLMSRQNYGIIRLTPLEINGLRERIMTQIHEVDTILFIGAGASVPFGYQTTDQFITEIRNMSLSQLEKRIFDFYAETSNITIEDIIRALDLRIKENDNPILRQEALSPLRTIELSDADWNDAKNKLQSEETTQKLEERLSAYKTLKDKIVSQLYVAYHDKPELGKSWDVYGDYIYILREQNGDVLPIFTTNYDGVIESLEHISDSDINRVVRGFKQVRRTYPPNPIWAAEEIFDREPKADAILLFKLHGSLNWRLDTKDQLREAQEGRFRLTGHWKANVLIPPGTEDYQYGEPYQSLRTYLEGYLAKAKACIVVGYRFDDLTIRDIFKRSLQRGLRLLMLNPEAEAIKSQKFPEFDNIVVIPKTIEEGAGDIKEVLRPSAPPTPEEAPPTEPEVKTPPTEVKSTPPPTADTG